MIEIKASEARSKQKDANDKKQGEYEKELKAADENKEKSYADFKKVLDDLQKKQQQGEEVDPARIQAAAVQLAMRQRVAERTAEVTKERLKRERDQELAEIERQRDQELQQIQNDYKLQATVFPPILPLLVGLAVWARRRIREREGVSRSRLRT
jgi:ABC-2 type transport system permease protein